MNISLRIRLAGSTARGRRWCAGCGAERSGWSASVGLARRPRFAPRPSDSGSWVTIPMFQPEPRSQSGSSALRRSKSCWRSPTLSSLHCPLTAETRGMIDAKALRRMRSDAILVNTARGRIVDMAALIAAIREGVIGGAGIDVLPMEPPSPMDEIAVAYRDLRAAGIADRLIVTPHAAWGALKVAPTRDVSRSRQRSCT